jgi:hypothetical protein
MTNEEHQRLLTLQEQLADARVILQSVRDELKPVRADLKLIAAEVTSRGVPRPRPELTVLPGGKVPISPQTPPKAPAEPGAKAIGNRSSKPLPATFGHHPPPV